MTAAIDITTEQRKTLLALLRRFIPGVAVWAYGSRVKWTARPNSDLDLVAFTTPAQRRLVSELKEALGESNLPFLVDLHVWDEVPERFHEIIRKEYVVFQEATQPELKLGMRGEWREVIVAEIASPARNALVGGPFGSDLVSRDYVGYGVPVIRGQNMGERWVSGAFVYVSQEKADSLESNLARPGDIVFTQRGTLGQVSLVPNTPFERYLVSQSQMKLTVDRGVADPLFYYYVFQSDEQQEYVRQHAIQTGVPHTNLGILRNTPVPLPPLPEQRAIAHILGTLDDKIELNRRMNETLEAIARALFKSWFVDFDPVRAKAEGRDPGLPKEIADLFPDSFENSELGEVPRGWGVRPFADTVEVLGGGTPKTSVADYWDGDIPWFSVVDAPRDADVWVVDTEKKVTTAGIENSSTRLLPEGTTIITARGTVGRVALVGVPMTMNQSCYGLRGKVGEKGFFTYFTTRSLVTNLQQHSHGSVFDTITRDTLKGLAVIFPSPEVINVFERKIDAAMQRIRGNISESRTLAVLRDTLLPKLLSGEVRAKEAERILEASS